MGCGGLVSCQQQGREPATPAPFASFFEQYRSEFEVQEYTGARIFPYEDRTLVYGDGPENIVEALVAYNYYCETLLAFDELYDHMGGEALQISVKKQKEDAEKGIYCTEQTIHSLDTLTEQDFAPGGDYFTTEEQAERFITDLSEVVAEYALTEYTVVYSDLSWKWSEAALEQGPQLGNGRYERLFLLGHTDNDESWKIYELFWGEDVLNRTWEEKNDVLAEQLVRMALEEQDYPTNPELTTLLYQTIGSRALMLVEVEGAPHIAGLDNLVMGVYDEDTQRFVGNTFDIHGDEPGHTSWWGPDGCLYVLCTNTIYYQEEGTSNGLSYFRFDGLSLEPIYDLPAPARSCGVLPDIPETETILHPVGEDPNSYNFWFTRRAWPTAMGFALYEKNPNWSAITETDEEQWLYVGYVPFAIMDSAVTNGAKDLMNEYIETT